MLSRGTLSVAAHARTQRRFLCNETNPLKKPASQFRRSDKAGSFRRKKGGTGNLSRGLAIGGFGVSAFGAWLGLDESEFASNVRQTLYDSKLGDAYKYAAVNVDEMTKGFTEPVTEKLLQDWPIPMFPPGTPQPMTLVLDLEETLVHPSFDRRAGWRHAKRPGVDKFLESLSCLKMNDETGQYQFRPMYEIVIFTSSLQHVAAEVIQILDKKKIVLHQLFREHTTFKNGKFVKDLSKLNRDLNRVIIIDDEEDSFLFQPENAIKIKPFNDPSDLGDSALLDLIPFLQAVARDETPGRDVRQVLASYEQRGSITDVYREETLIKLQENMDRRSRGIGGVIRASKDDLRKAPAAQLGTSLTKKLESGEIYQEQEEKEVNQLLQNAKRRSGGGLRGWLQSRAQDDEERQQMKLQAYHETMEKRARTQHTDTQE